MNIRHFLVALPLAFFLAAPVFAQNTKTPTPTTVKGVEYTLPYPGVLPDHPVYWLKAIRDRVLDFLIVDPLRKAEFYLLQADKRLGMGVSLVEKGNSKLAEETISKGEKYLWQAVTNLVAVKAGGKEVPKYIIDRLIGSVAKHEEVLTELMAKTTGPQHEGLKGSLELLRQTSKELTSLQQ